MSGVSNVKNFIFNQVLRKTDLIKTAPKSLFHTKVTSQKFDEGSNSLNIEKRYRAIKTQKQPYSTKQLTELFFRILTIDGGGIRGIIPGKVLKYMETYAKKPISFLFDYIGGTSTGALLALLAAVSNKLGENQFSAEEMLSLYTGKGMSEKIFSPAPKEHSGEKGFTIFNISPRPEGGFVMDTDLPLRELLHTKYTAENLEALLLERFGEKRLKDLLTEVLITAVDLKTQKPKFFTREKARKDHNKNFLLRDVARATSAAPTVFDSHNIGDGDYVDGGVAANNPTIWALLNAYNQKIPFEKMICVSLGTGVYDKEVFQTKGYGLLPYAPKLFDLMFKTSSFLSQDSSEQLLGKRYHRIDATLEENIPLDTTDERIIEKLKNIGDQLINDKQKDIETICDQLKEIGERKAFLKKTNKLKV